MQKIKNTLRVENLEKKELILDSVLFIYSFNRDMAPRDKVKFIRELFGYRLSKNQKRYAYKGILQKLNGIKLSNNAFLVNKENSQIVQDYLESRGVDFVLKK
jgi:hypothetical protein